MKKQMNFGINFVSLQSNTNVSRQTLMTRR